MRVSDEDRRRFRRQADALDERENDSLVDAEHLNAMMSHVNEWRRRRGIEALDVKDEDSSERPEMELHRRARALGMVGRSGGGDRSGH